MIRSTPIRSFARAQDGFTLIELLVAMISATVLAGAVFAMLSFSTNETAALDDKVSSDQLGRIAMTRVVDELHSACIAPAFIPVLEKSTPTQLRFENAYSEEAELKSAERHTITWNKEKKTLVEANFPDTGGTWPDFLFPKYEKNEPTSTITIAKNVNENPGATPIFRYLTYSKETNESATTGVSTLEPLKLTSTEESEGISSTVAPKVAAVEINFNVAPSDGIITLNRSFDLNNLVTFAFSVPNAETPIHDAPCE
jgi:prepilin-type N-terminal cleavage/methylation domain-containing protein